MFLKNKRSKYGKRVDFKHEMINYKADLCYIPTNGYCSIKCINSLTGLDFIESYFELIRNKKRRSNVMTQARTEPCCKAMNVNIGYYKGKDFYPRMVAEKNKCLYFYNDHYCLI